VFLGVAIGMYIAFHQDNINEHDEKLYEKIAIFIKIDDIAHQEIEEDADENPFTTQELKDEFYNIDNEYHSTKDLEKKYAAEKKMVNLLEEAEENRPTVTGDKESDFEKDEEYRELIEQYEEIK
jgi:hypothetical protein